jgi:hypothetical protein
MIEKILNEDGTEWDPPRNPLEEKWLKKYPACESKGYKCIYCSKCPSGDNWEVPEEDKHSEEWITYLVDLCRYNLDHGNVVNDFHRAKLKQMLEYAREHLERIEYEESKNLH